MDVHLTPEESKEIWDVLNGNEVKGGRAIDGLEHMFQLWG